MTSTSAPALRPPHADAPTPPPRRWPAHVVLLGVQLAYASFPVLGKQAFDGFSPLAVASWRLVVGSTVFATAALVVYRSRVRLDRRDLLYVFVLSLLGMTLNQVMFIVGLSLSTATHAALLMAVIPPATYAIAVAAGRERVALRKVLGIACASAGVVVLLARSGDVGGTLLRGDLLITVNACFYAGYLVLAKPLLERRPPLVVLAWAFVLGSLCVLPFGLREDMVPTAASAKAWRALLAILIVPTTFAYFGNIWALKRVDASVAGIYVCLQPMVSVTAAVIVLGEPFTPLTALTGVLVLVGVAAVSIRRRRRPAG